MRGSLLGFVHIYPHFAGQKVLHEAGLQSFELLQPEPPSTILIDEPELGLHPFALEILGNLILQAQERTQLIVSTQSAPMLNSFEPDQIIAVERHEGESTFKSLEKTDLKTWLEDYTLGELWQKNVYGGGPVHE